jgi:hypothetical protein
MTKDTLSSATTLVLLLPITLGTGNMVKILAVAKFVARSFHIAKETIAVENVLR